MAGRRRFDMAPSAGIAARARQSYAHAVADNLIRGETMIWHGRPSWRSEVSFYLRWAAIGLIPLVVIIVARAISSADWSIPLGVGIFLVVLALAVLVGFLRRYFTQYTIT